MKRKGNTKYKSRNEETEKQKINETKGCYFEKNQQN